MPRSHEVFWDSSKVPTRLPSVDLADALTITFSGVPPFCAAGRARPLGFARVPPPLWGGLGLLWGPWCGFLFPLVGGVLASRSFCSVVLRRAQDKTAAETEKCKKTAAKAAAKAKAKAIAEGTCSQ